jgi:hypothetical protein
MWVGCIVSCTTARRSTIREAESSLCSAATRKQGTAPKEPAGADRLRELGVVMDRATIAKIENGRAAFLSMRH